MIALTTFALAVALTQGPYGFTKPKPQPEILTKDGAAAVPGILPGKGAVVKWETYGSVYGGLNTASSTAMSWWNAVWNAAKLGELLTQEDAGYIPRNPPGSPDVPSHCASEEGRRQCRQCGFQETHAALANVRERFERLRRVYGATKAFYGQALASGDAMAGAAAATRVAMGGLPWIYQRVKIEQAMKGVDSAYDNKYKELTSTLQAVLRQMAVCEEQVFGQEDWYDRYGFIYYEFVTTAYRRP